MYRDNSLIPSEAIRLLALGILATGKWSYAQLASESAPMARALIAARRVVIYHHLVPAPNRQLSARLDIM